MNRQTLLDAKTWNARKHTDDRGFFIEVFNSNMLTSILDPAFRIETVSELHSNHMAVRGLHYQLTYPQARIVRVSAGEIFDVILDMRKSSPTFGKWKGEVITAKRHNAMFIPKGFAHGYLTLTEQSIVSIYADEKWVPTDQHCVFWNDPALAIDWPLSSSFPVLLDPTVSDRDLRAPKFADADYYDF